MLTTHHTSFTPSLSPIQYVGSDIDEEDDSISTVGSVRVHVNSNRESNPQKQDNWVDFYTQWTDATWHHIAGECMCMSGGMDADIWVVSMAALLERGVQRCAVSLTPSVHPVSHPACPLAAPAPPVQLSCATPTPPSLTDHPHPSPSSHLVVRQGHGVPVPGRQSNDSLLDQPRRSPGVRQSQGRGRHPHAVSWQGAAVGGEPGAGSEPGVHGGVLPAADGARWGSGAGEGRDDSGGNGDDMDGSTLSLPLPSLLNTPPPQLRIWEGALSSSDIQSVMLCTWDDLSRDQQSSIAVAIEFTGDAQDGAKFLMDRSAHRNHMYMGECLYKQMGMGEGWCGCA